MPAVQQDWRALEFVADEMRADKEVVLTAVRQDWNALRCSLGDFTGDKDVILAVLQQNGGLSEHVSDDLKADKEVVLARSIAFCKRRTEGSRGGDEGRPRGMNRPP
eukprot:Sspe_Gene.118842::Locus_113255_Transcript_1_1_Confidence_1.000_Length_395::g.118842::m.118842